MPKLSLELGLAVDGIILTIILVVLDKRCVSTTLRHSHTEISEYSRLSFVVC